LIIMPTVFKGRVFSVEASDVTLPNGRQTKVEVVRHPRSVVLIPMPTPASVILVRQYRFAVNQWLWELPAGSVDEGEEPEAAARRECNEEIGQIPQAVMRLGTFLPTPGYCDEEMVFFKVSSLETPDTAAQQDDDEDIEVKTFMLAEARDMIRRGEISDMKTIVGLRLI
jgi:ADP-ribose pyrophosphatase